MFQLLFGKRRRSNTASIAKERLQIIVAHERVKNMDGNPDFMQDLQRDILEVVRRYLPVESEQINIAMERDGDCDVLELNIVLSDDEK
ncbi:MULTISPECIES: cell division topological specificity factor MinE [Ignatzschineria]|uniref:Cell division topological specificity factor n=1 Tax=Ignatzschineria cameli TaxID=2182793 RepID=A0A2U2AR69_9GAMM|nr:MULTISPECIES: cell division topological specificity factor MinE [Ignatzschineria]OYQ80726.1 cell division topological specificity factor MinE [Ignatzschineria sp. F8392]PWD85215.1 cell division topological specificity factor MinE [Ignatzschineria cameli]PWD86359.1 cell division topological specificity factor MinE [Ignatzschineria cameli]PWD89803.1 cell division topological specificity factor MinE [Ignatzschineria cameli]PWD91453.1 cell division topological specificity factor MinE [Ignatzsch